jgi:hypothetical protein
MSTLPEAGMYQLQIMLEPSATDVFVELSFAPQDTVALRARLSESLVVFGTAVRYWIFSQELISADRSAFELQTEIPTVRGEGIRWHCTGRFLQSGAYWVLLNLIRTAAVSDPGLLGVTVRSAGALQAAAHSDPAKVGGPTTISPLPFAVTDEMPDPPPRELVIRMELDDAATDEALEQMRTGMSVWSELIGCGAFVTGAGAAEQRDTLSATNLYLVTPKLAEYCIYGSFASRAAIEVLLNLLAHIHHKVIRIGSIEME